MANHMELLKMVKSKLRREDLIPLTSKLAEMPEVTGLLHVYGEQTTKALLLRKLASALALPVRVVDQTTPVRDFRLCTTRPDVLARLDIPPLDVQIELSFWKMAGLCWPTPGLTC